MLPDPANHEAESKAFQVIVENHGMARPRRSVSAVPAAWQQCVNCESYRHCYDYCLARLLLYIGLTAA